MEYEVRNLGGMNDLIASKWSSLKPKLIVATMFLKLNMSLTPNNLVDVTISLIWNTLTPSHLKSPNDIDNSNDNENEENDDLSSKPVESEEIN